MITGAIRSQVDQVWDAFWSGGVSNPLTVIEQITYLLFAKRLDELHTAREKQANLQYSKHLNRQSTGPFAVTCWSEMEAVCGESETHGSFLLRSNTDNTCLGRLFGVICTPAPSTDAMKV